MTTTDTAPAAGSSTAFTPQSDRSALLAHALAYITAGRPLPEPLRPTVLRSAAPATAQEGIAAILAGPGGDRARR